MTYLLSLSDQAESWFEDAASRPYTLPVAEWLAELCDEPRSKRSAPVPNIDGLPTKAAFVESIVEAGVIIAVSYTVIDDPEFVRVHKIVGNWSVPFM